MNAFSTSRSLSLVRRAACSLVPCALALVITACVERGTSPESPSLDEPGQPEVEQKSPLQVAIASSDLAVGQERFAFALLDENGGLIPEATVSLSFFKLEGEIAEPAGDAEARFFPSKLEEAGLYVVYVEFDRAGMWGAEIRASLADGSQPSPQRVRFNVAQIPAGPAVGEKAPRSENRTIAGLDPDSTEAFEVLAEITSDPNPDPELYALSVAEAVETGRPSAVLFATPAYCQSRICGPVMDEFKDLKAEFGDRINFLHIEVVADFETGGYVPEMQEWGLATEPWVFVLDPEGRVAARLEGSATQAEIAPILAGLLESP